MRRKDGRLQFPRENGHDVWRRAEPLPSDEWLGRIGIALGGLTTPLEHVVNPWHGDFRFSLGQVRFQPRRRLVLNPATPFEPRSKIARIGLADARYLALMTESPKLDRFRHASFLPESISPPSRWGLDTPQWTIVAMLRCPSSLVSTCRTSAPQTCRQRSFRRHSRSREFYQEQACTHTTLPCTK
jgi:hypothetical protein